MPPRSARKKVTPKSKKQSTPSSSIVEETLVSMDVVVVPKEEETVKQEMDVVVSKVEVPRISMDETDFSLTNTVLIEETQIVEETIIEETQIVEEMGEEKNLGVAAVDDVMAEDVAVDDVDQLVKLYTQAEPEEEYNMEKSEEISEEEGDQVDPSQGDNKDEVCEETAVEEATGGDAGDDNVDGTGNADLEGEVGDDNVDGAGDVDQEGEDEESENEEEDEDPSISMQKKQKEMEVFVGGLDRKAAEEDLIEVFKEFGEIQAVRIVKNPNNKKNKGYAFIRFATVEEAKKCLTNSKDGIEVKGKRVGVSPSQDSDTLYLSNICKTWTKEQVSETLKSLGVEKIEEIHLPDDPNNEGKIEGFALLEFNNHFDAMAAFHRLRKPDAVFGCAKSAKVALQPTEEALLQVKTVFLEGLTRSWDEDKLNEICQQYGEIEKIQLSWKLASKKKRKDFAFVSFTSRESAEACVNGINNADISEGEARIKANIAKPQRKSRLGKQGPRGGFKVQNDGEKTDGATPSKARGKTRSRGAERKGKSPFHPKLKSAQESKPVKSQGSFLERRSAEASTRALKRDRPRNEQFNKGGKRGGRSKDTVNSERPSKKPRGNMRANDFGNRGNNAVQRGSNGVHRGNTSGNRGNNFSIRGNNFRNRENNSRSGNERLVYSRVPPRQTNTYSLGHATSASGSKRSYSDMEPHAGYLKPAVVNHGRREDYGRRDEYVRREAYGYYEPRRVSGYDDRHVSSSAAYGGGSVLPPTYVPAYPSYALFESGSAAGGYGYPSNSAYPPPRQYYYQ
ncbi:hypothetical protein GIB67_042133 [Kingdonia uniflora]|uniref:RRM domain-containing protein n=1 Tax=Kingdonia uniflora TaxID=39325 RepID=A0A7J7NNT4_9MAGN|nr:hypothetical protein GIB67_042133 [Kingdonia uniflora]